MKGFSRGTPSQSSSRPRSAINIISTLEKRKGVVFSSDPMCPAWGARHGGAAFFSRALPSRQSVSLPSRALGYQAESRPKQAGNLLRQAEFRAGRTEFRAGQAGFRAVQAGFQLSQEDIRLERAGSGWCRRSSG